MPAPELHEYDASSVDVRIVGEIAVLSMMTDQGRVVASTTIDEIQRLSLRIQMELANATQRPPAN